MLHGQAALFTRAWQDIGAKARILQRSRRQKEIAEMQQVNEGTWSESGSLRYVHGWPFEQECDMEFLNLLAKVKFVGPFIPGSAQIAQSKWIHIWILRLQAGKARASSAALDQGFAALQDSRSMGLPNEHVHTFRSLFFPTPFLTLFSYDIPEMNV